MMVSGTDPGERMLRRPSGWTERTLEPHIADGQVPSHTSPDGHLVSVVAALPVLSVQGIPSAAESQPTPNPAERGPP